MSAPTTPQRGPSFGRRLTRAFTMSPPRPASPQTTTTTTGTPGRVTPTRSNTRDASTTASKRSSLPLFTRKSGLGSRGPSTDAVNEFGAKATAKAEPATAAEPSKQDAEAPKQDAEPPKDVEAPKPDTEAPKQDATPATPGHTRARSGSTVSSQGPMTPPPAAQTSEPIEIPKSEDPMSDSPHDGASIASSRSPSRLRRQVSNLSRHSISGSIRRLSLLGPSSPPQVEATAAVAVGEMQPTLSRSASISSLRRHAASPEPVVPEVPEPAAVETAPKEEPVAPAPQPEPAQAAAPQPEPVQAAPQPEPVQAAPQPEPVQAAPQPEPVQAAPQPAPAPVKESTPAPSTKAPSTIEVPQQVAPKPAEPQTPVKPSASRNASTSSLTRSPTPDRPEPKRRGTLSNWARKSIDKTLDRRSSVSSPPPVRSPSRGPAESGAESDTDSIKERERRWNTGLPVPKLPTPKKSEDNIKRRFSLGRRPSESGIKTPSESIAESDKDKKPNWASKMLRAGSKSKKDKGDGSATTPEASTTDVTTTATTAVTATEQVESPIEPPRPSIAIPNAFSPENRPLSAIVESPNVPLNSHAIWAIDGPAVAATTLSPLAATATTESPVVVKAEPPSPETSPVVVEEPATPALVAAVEPEPTKPVEAPAAPEVVAEPNPWIAATPVEATASPVATEPEQPKDAPAAPVEETVTPVEAPAPVEEAPAPVEDAAAPEPGTSTPPVDADAAPATAENLLSPMSPNSPASTPWDASVDREIARARSPRRSTGGPSNANRSLRASPAPSIIGVKRKNPDEPEAVGQSRVRYLPDWAVSPAIQLAVTLSLVLPRRRRDVANPTNRKRGWWPLRRGPRTELRYNAIRGVNEEVPIVSKSWAVPAAVRTTAKVVTAPARWMFHFFVPRSTRG